MSTPSVITCHPQKHLVAAPPDHTLIDGEEEYEVEEILKYRYCRQQHQFLIAWKGYGRSH